MERRGPLLLWEEGMRVCCSQVEPFVVTFRRLLSALASTQAPNLKKIFNCVHCSATPQREAAPATKSTRGQSQLSPRLRD